MPAGMGRQELRREAPGSGMLLEGHCACLLVLLLQRKSWNQRTGGYSEPGSEHISAGSWWWALGGQPSARGRDRCGPLASIADLDHHLLVGQLATLTTRPVICTGSFLPRLFFRTPSPRIVQEAQLTAGADGGRGPCRLLPGTAESLTCQSGCIHRIIPECFAAE